MPQCGAGSAEQKSKLMITDLLHCRNNFSPAAEKWATNGITGFERRRCLYFLLRSENDFVDYKEQCAGVSFSARIIIDRNAP